MDFSSSVIKLWNREFLDSTNPFDAGGSTPQPTPGPLTITGSGFGTKAQAAPIKFDQFKDYADDSVLQVNDPAWQEYQTNGGALIKSDRPRYAGGKYAYNDSTRSGFATNSLTFAPTDKVFFSYWFSTDQATYGDDGTYWIGKLGRISSSAAAGGGGGSIVSHVQCDSPAAGRTQGCCNICKIFFKLSIEDS